MKKQILILFVAIVTMVSFSSCTKDSIEKTTWTGKITFPEEALELPEGVEIPGGITLPLSSLDVSIYYKSETKFDFATSIMGFSTSIEGVYTYEKPTVNMTVTLAGQSMTLIGTISGDKMNVSALGQSFVFTKK